MQTQRATRRTLQTCRRVTHSREGDSADRLEHSLRALSNPSLDLVVLLDTLLESGAGRVVGEVNTEHRVAHDAKELHIAQRQLITHEVVAVAASGQVTLKLRKNRNTEANI